MNMAKILLVEDNEMIVKGLKFSLEQNHFEVEVAFTYKEALEKSSKDIWDLIILDITLPDGNGLTLGENIKSKSDVPIMFLTAKDEEDDVVYGLDLGAEDYIIKPFRTKELLSRIVNVLKRRQRNKMIQVKNVVLDLDKCEVLVDGQIVSLTSLEFKILCVLFTNLNKVVLREVIIDKIWDIDGNFVNDNTLSVYIKRIREKLGNEDIIKTIKGIGYRVDQI